MIKFHCLFPFYVCKNGVMNANSQSFTGVYTLLYL